MITSGGSCSCWGTRTLQRVGQKNMDATGGLRVRQQIAVELANGVGTTETFGPRGAYFLTDVQVSVGDALSFILLLPDPLNDRNIRLHCHGTVMGVELRAGQYGVDTAIESLWVE